MKYLAKVWTSALTFGALMMAGSTGASAHRVNNAHQLNNPQNHHQLSTKVVNHPKQNRPAKKTNVYPLYHFQNAQNQFRLGSVTSHKVRHAKRNAIRKPVNHFKMSHHFTKRHSNYSKDDNQNQVNANQSNNSTDNNNDSDSQTSNFANSKMAKLASTKLGDPYVWGATGANAFDCSGFTQYLYKNAKHITLPRTAQAQYDYGKHVTYNNVKPGNLVFFGYTPSSISHVGLYIGNGKMIDAQNRGVVIENVIAPWWNLVGCANVDL